METKNLLNKKITQWLLLVAMLIGCNSAMYGDTWALKGTWDNWSSFAGFYSNKCTLTLSIGTTEFQVIKNGDTWYGNTGTYKRGDGVWGFGQGSGNCKVTVDVPGTYTFNISWNGSTPQIKIDYPWGVYGNFDGSWKLWPINDGVANITGVTKGDHEYKIYTSKASSCNCSSCGKMTRNNCSGWQFYDNNNNNACMNADIVGTYKFSWNESTFKLSVTYPEHLYAVGIAVDNTWSNFIEMTPDGTGVYYYDLQYLGDFKFSNKQGWPDNEWYGKFTNEGTSIGITFKNGPKDNKNNCNIKDIQSGYEFPVRFYIDTNTNTLWAKATQAACSTPAKPTLAAKSGATTVCSGSKPAFTVTGAVSGAKYTLYAGSTSVGTVTASSTSVDITANTSISSQTIYKVKACSGTTGCESYCSDFSSTVTINVDPKSVAGTITGVVSPICSGSTENLTLTGSTGTIQWKKSTDGGSSWSNVGTGATTYSETVTAATKYKVSVKSGVCAAAETAASSVAIKTAPSKPSISGPTKICATTSGNTYTITGDADSYEIATGGYLDYQLNNKTITVTTGADEHSSYLKVTSVNCTSLKTASDQYNINIYQSAAKGTVSLLVDDVAGTSACMGQTVSASQTGFRTGGGTGSWSSTNTTIATVNSSTGAVTLNKAGSTDIKYTISNPTCGSSVNDYKTLTVKGTSFTLTGNTTSKAWKPVTLSTSPATQATWSVTPNDNGAYLSNITGTSSTLKAPAPQSSGSTSYTVRAEAEVDGCHAAAQKIVSVQYETCQ